MSSVIKRTLRQTIGNVSLRPLAAAPVIDFRGSFRGQSRHGRRELARQLMTRNGHQ